VTNTGVMDADDVVLGFLTPPSAGVNGVPLQTLYAFDRVRHRFAPASAADSTDFRSPLWRIFGHHVDLQFHSWRLLYCLDIVTHARM